MLTNLLNALLIAVLYLSLPPQLRPDTGGKSPRHDVTALVRQLGDPHEGVRESAKLILVEIGAPAIPGLVPTLKQGNREAQSAALWVVTRIGPPAIKAAPTVADLLNDKDACVRIEAVLAIARIDPEGSVARLVKVLRCDKEEDVKEEAASELGRLGSLAKQAIPVLACEMRKGGPLGWICASALGKTGPEAARPLLDVLADPRMDWAVKREARMALGRMRPVAKETVPELVMLVRKNKSDIGTVV